MSLVDHQNWDAYHGAFSQTFKQLEEALVDPNKFPKRKKILTHLQRTNSLLSSVDKNDKTGFWMMYQVSMVRGHFICPVDPTCSWSSSDVQIDISVS